MKKLRRVTTELGFTRLSAPSADLQGDYSDAAKLSALTLSQDWLPATEIFGEGVLIRLNEEQVQKWEARDVVLQRALALRAGYIREFGDGADPALFPGIRYFMLHSLSHLLINAMALVRMFLDIEQLSKRLEQQIWREKRAARLEPLKQARVAGSAAFASEVLTLFRELHWPYQEPAPALYFDPRTADKYAFVSLHAKCIIVDEEHVLITSANFTGRGQDRNIEVGIVVHDKGYAVALERQWNNLVQSGDVRLG